MTTDDVELPDAGPTDLDGKEAADARRRLADASLRDAMLLKVSWLRSFLAVAERGGFGAATSTLSRASVPTSRRSRSCSASRSSSDASVRPR